MGREKFIWCRNCDAIHHVTPFDKAPFYTLVAGEVRESAADDWRHFMEQHAGHRLEPLKATSEKLFPNGSMLDPMNVGYIEVTNGQDRLLLRQTRRSIEEPLVFELVSGRLVDRGVTLEVQEDEIRKEMKRHISQAPTESLDNEKIDLFIALFKEFVRGLNPRAIEVGGYSYTDDNIAYGLLEARLVEELMARCAAYFLPGELAGIRRFVDIHTEGCDVMSVVMRRQVTVEQLGL